MEAVKKTFQVFLDRFLVPVDDPGSRLFYVNLLTTALFLLFFAAYSLKKPTLTGTLKQIRFWVFRKKYWWNSSTKVDYQLYLLNGFLKALIFIPWLDLSYFFAKNTVVFLNASFRKMEAWPTSTGIVFLFTLGAFVFDDFLRFAHHYLMHKIPWLWRFHQTHHSARILTPITLYRAHPVEVLMSTVRNSLSAGVAVGFFVYLFSSQVSYFNILSVNLFGFVFNFLGSNLRHSHIPLSFGFLENIFISPKQHQIHHSKDSRYFDKNFGVSLSLWDRLIGTLALSKSTDEKIQFGLKGVSSWKLQRILLPFRR